MSIKRRAKESAAIALAAGVAGGLGGYEINQAESHGPATTGVAKVEVAPKPTEDQKLEARKDGVLKKYTVKLGAEVLNDALKEGALDAIPDASTPGGYAVDVDFQNGVNGSGTVEVEMKKTKDPVTGKMKLDPKTTYSVADYETNETKGQNGKELSFDHEYDVRNHGKKKGGWAAKEDGDSNTLSNNVLDGREDTQYGSSARVNYGEELTPKQSLAEAQKIAADAAKAIVQDIESK